MNDIGLWEPHPIEQDQCLEAQVGPLQLWIRRSGDEIHIASKHRKASDSSTKAAALSVASERTPVGLDWGRWVCGDSSRVLLVPTTPDRPVVVRPEVPLRIPPGKEALFFVGVPVWVRILAGDEEMIKLCEEPSVGLSGIWFGDPMSVRQVISWVLLIGCIVPGVYGIHLMRSQGKPNGQRPGDAPLV